MTTTNTEFPTRQYLRRSDIVYDGILMALREGHTQKSASKIVGVTRSTVYLWREADPAFDAAVVEAMRTGVARLVRDRLLVSRPLCSHFDATHRGS
jgi:Homeodomain-like domain